MSIKSIVDGKLRQTKTDHKSSPCHYVTGELIKESKKSLPDRLCFQKHGYFYFWPNLKKIFLQLLKKLNLWQRFF